MFSLEKIRNSIHSFFERNEYMKKTSLLVKSVFINNPTFVFILLIMFLFFNKLFYVILGFKGSYVAKIVASISNINLLWTGKVFPIGINTLIALGIVSIFILRYVFLEMKGKTRKGEEHGSASWGAFGTMRPYISPVFKDNLLLTQNVRLSYTKPKSIEYARNKNVLICGGSGTGKTRFFVTTNILQDGRSLVLTDPKGTILEDVGSFLVKKGYNIKVLNTIDFSKSMKYNPFKYIENELDVMSFVETLIANTSGSGQKEDFWVKSEKTLFMALIGYIIFECPEEDHNMASLLTLLKATSPEDGLEISSADTLFQELAEINPNHFAVNNYLKFKSGAEETIKGILISAGVRLSCFDIEELRDMTSEDELDLDEIGDEKTALFFITSDTDDSLNFLGAIMYSQLFNILCRKADNFYGGSLPVHVRFILDEFANIGRIPKFEQLIATVRSREISICPILQSISQLKAIYEKGKDEVIIANCDTFLFLGGTDDSTLKYVSNFLGNQTIDTSNESVSYGQSKSNSVSNQKLARKLMTEDELAVLNNKYAIVRIRGERPIKDFKFNLEKHPNYKYLACADKKNSFDIEKYLQDFRTPETSVMFKLRESQKVVQQLKELDLSDYI